ncbi:hypothetical protein PM082_014992 [Marasmius tenuissimus]|nr:hypothetical protein PM082_014992 [Marasmius tenuissimus]
MVIAGGMQAANQSHACGVLLSPKPPSSTLSAREAYRGSAPIPSLTLKIKSLSTQCFVLDDTGEDSSILHDLELPKTSRDTTFGASIVMNAIGLSGAIMGTVAFSDKSRPTSLELFKAGDEILSGWALASLSFNGFVTILTSGRIWRVSRDARETMGEDVKKRYGTVVAIILESGMLYPTVQLARTILHYTYIIGPIPIDIGSLSTQAAVRKFPLNYYLRLSLSFIT